MEMSQYLEVFIEESKEHLQACNANLLELEKNPQNIAIVNEIFRSAHTLKGMSATMGYEDLAKLTHQMENVLDGIRQMKIKVSPELLDVIFLAVDDLEAMVLSISEGGDGKRDVSVAVEKLVMIEKGENPANFSSKNGTDNKPEENIQRTVKSEYDEFELTVLQQSREQGFNAYEISISLRADCLLKAARVFMIFEAVENLGEVIKSTPSVDQLEEELFDSSFTITIVSKEEGSTIQKKLMNISEVDIVDARLITDADIRNRPQDEFVSPIVISKAEEQLNAEAPEVIEEDPKKKSGGKQPSAGNKTIRVNIERLDILMNLFEELVIDRGRLEQISRELNNQELNETVERMSRISGDLQNIILNMRMVPVETVFNRFPKMVRQLARDLNKKIKLEIIGAETELDRTVIDEIGDPLVHLLRNAMDHGIETPEIRKTSGKNEEGTVVLKAYHSGNHVFIEIEDDGAGISREKVLMKAINNGIVSEKTAASLTDKQVFELIFASGFSTADKISDISGRGVGLDVVKNTIESLGGSVTIDSVLGKGSVFSIQLPLTLSIISVMLVQIQEEKFAIPLTSIIETAIVKKEEILNAHNQKVIDFRGKVVPLLFLKDLFNVPVTKENEEFY
ncbi:MAG: chemotaxis protein CheA, partial [Bacillota bacterium]|nr:chemotaxis protein CheA [Bacillota bacterium]